MNATTWFLVIVAAVIVAFVMYGRARRARGSIEMALPKSDFELGETIHGRVDIHAKQPIEAERLVVTLTATEITETVKDGKTTSSSKQVHRGEHVLEGARSYAAGTRETREFEIAVPAPKPAPEPPATGNKAAFAKLAAMAGPKVRLQWRLEVRLAAKGIDLATARSITVHTEKL